MTALSNELKEWRLLDPTKRKKVIQSSVRFAEELEGLLMGARNSRTVKALGLGVAAAGLKDCLERINITGSRLRYEYVERYLIDRMGEVTKIDRYNRVDKVSLSLAIVEQQAILEQIAELANLTKDLPSKIDFQKFSIRERYLESIGLSNHDLNRLQDRPFVAFRDQIKLLREQFSSNARQGRQVEAAKSMSGIAIYACFAQIEFCLQWAQFELVRGKDAALSAKAHIDKAIKLIEPYAPKYNLTRSGLERASEACCKLALIPGDSKKEEEETKSIIDSIRPETILLKELSKKG